MTIKRAEIDAWPLCGTISLPLLALSQDMERGRLLPHCRSREFFEFSEEIDTLHLQIPSPVTFTHNISRRNQIVLLKGGSYMEARKCSARTVQTYSKLKLRPSGCTVSSWKISFISSCLRNMLVPLHKRVSRTWRSVILGPAELKRCAISHLTFVWSKEERKI